ncbi:MAG: gliding motility-associated C-terminal domain-containing protein, partial [Bacteroidota bacterium]
MKTIQFMHHFLAFWLFPFLALAQVSDHPCDLQELQNLLITEGQIHQSTTFGSGLPNYAMDGITSATWADGHVSRTENEDQAWIEIDLGQIYALGSMEIWYPADLYPEGLNDYYILISSSAFSSNEISDLLTQIDITYLHVEGVLSSGTAIPLSFQSGRYVRLQRANPGFLAFSEIIIPGTDTEICDNGEDDDCDGKIDCEDEDCGPGVSNIDVSQVPSCQGCTDGVIAIQSSREGIKYSIDGGLTFQASPVFEGLPPGDYTIVVLNEQTGCQYEETISFKAIAGQPNDCCDNGDFETGTFENWEGGSGVISTDGDVTIIGDEILDDGGFAARHAIIPGNSNYEDLSIQGLPVFSTTTGDFVARLGNTEARRRVEQLRYEFEVEDCNTDFRFNYLVVGEDPPTSDHGVDENGFFEYRITSLNTGDIIEQDEETVNIDDLDFSVGARIGDLSIVYTNWLCVSVDLSEYIGQKVVAEFTVADCQEGAHWCYAYINGLCNSAASMTPIVNLNANPIICSNQDIWVDASRSLGYSRFAWKVCQLENGQPINCVEDDDFRRGMLGQFNASDFYEENGESILCGERYRISLTLENDCVPAQTDFIDVLYTCASIEPLVYRDILNCGPLEDIPIEGIDNCPGCQFQWSPGNVFLNNDTLAFPIIEATRNVTALDTNYIVTATNEAGCQESDTVLVYDVSNLAFDLEAQLEVVNYCSYQFFAQITATGEALPTDLIEALIFTNTTQNIDYTGVLIESDTNYWRYSLEEVLIDTDIGSEDQWQAAAIFNTRDYNILDNCTLNDSFDTLMANSIFHGPLSFIMPNIFSPDGDGNNDTFYPVGGFDERTNANAYMGQLRIFNRYGQKLFDSGEVFASP